ncbi:hypothetical protein [Salinicola aestuarinus]|uniref:hypothetical protein n=1 Tax=Salinicola aestuarinus TaxID=1949082 RepID=UPI0013005696|nr:hypothetical protein [Salinicola aestuarinus]
MDTVISDWNKEVEIKSMKDITTKKLMEIFKFIDSEEYHPRELGTFDGARRFELFNAYETITSVRVRPASRAWPFSVYKHCFTKKYKNSLKDKINRVIESRK